ncbi:MAG: FAD:protein FMN transferase, partial [Isosphaeraceae bacterium]
PPTEERLSTSDLIRASRPGMGSNFEVRLGATVPGAMALATRALDLIDTLESQLTIYRDDSELSRLNATAHRGPVEVEPRLFGLLEKGLEISRATQGAYDLTTGALSAAWGFTRGPLRVPSPEALDEARSRCGIERLTLDATRRTVRFDRAGVIVNLGSIGKGYALDRVAELIRAHWFPTGALVHGGRSSLYALGSPPGDFGGRWEVALRNPFDPEHPLGILRLRNRGMGTSGSDFQRFESGGRVYGHILDPRTGEPANGPASVTVLAPTAAEADALSTAFYLLGPNAAADHVRANPGIAALFVERGSEEGPVTLVTVGLDASDFQSTRETRLAPIAIQAPKH